METVINLLQSLLFIWLFIFVLRGVQLYSENSSLFSKYNIPASQKLILVFLSSLLIINLPDVIKILNGTLFPEKEVETQLQFMLSIVSQGVAYGLYCILLFVYFMASINTLQHLKDKAFHLRNIEHFQSMSSDEVLEWSWKAIQSEETYRFKQAQPAILEAHPELKEHVLFTSNPQNIRYIKPTD